jgi:hypothetical protein
MRVRNANYDDKSGNNFAAAQLPVAKEKSAAKSKLNISLERKVERLRCHSRRLSWSYNDFVTHLFEVLVIIQHRKK